MEIASTVTPANDGAGTTTQNATKIRKIKENNKATKVCKNMWTKQSRPTLQKRRRKKARHDARRRKRRNRPLWSLLKRKATSLTTTRTHPLILIMQLSLNIPVFPKFILAHPLRHPSQTSGSQTRVPPHT